MTDKIIVTVASLIKDKSKGAARIEKNPGILNDLNLEEVNELATAFEAYAPSTPGGQDLHKKVTAFIEARIFILEQGDVAADLEPDQVAEVAETPAEPTQETEVSEAAVDIAVKSVKDRSTVLEFRAHGTNFRKSVKSTIFAAKVKDPDMATVEERAKEIEENDESPDFKRVAVIQQTIGKDFIQPLEAQRASLKMYLRSRAVPCSMLSSDRFLVPHALIGEVDSEIAKFEAERKVLLDEFEAKYEEAKAEAKAQLKEHYDETKYEPFSVVRSKFFIVTSWRDEQPSAALKLISESRLKEEKRKESLKWVSTYDEIRTALRTGFGDLINSFADAMGHDEDGKPRVFHASKVQHLKDFIQTFEARDLTDDADLANLAKQARELLGDTDAKAIRSDEAFRATLETGFKALKDQAAELTVTKGRTLDLED